MPTTCLANAGVPMLYVHAPVFVAALIPIILIETFVARWIMKVPWSRCASGVAVANLVSTLAGVPLTWVLLVIVQMMCGGGGAHGLHSWATRLYAVTVQSPWLIPYEKDLHWMIPEAALFALIPFCLVSILIERRIEKAVWRGLDQSRLNLACTIGNLASYAGLGVFWLVVLFWPTSS